MLINYVKQLLGIKKRIPKEVLDIVTCNDDFMTMMEWDGCYYQIGNFLFALPPVTRINQ